MNVYDIIGGVMLLISAVFIILFVVMQNHSSDGLSALGGSNEMAERGRTKTKQAILAKWTRIFGIIFVALSLVVNLLNVYLNK